MNGSQLLTKEISIMQSLDWLFVVDLGLAALLEPFLTRSFHNEGGSRDLHQSRIAPHVGVLGDLYRVSSTIRFNQ